MNYPDAWTNETDINAERAVVSRLAITDTCPPHLEEVTYSFKGRDGDPVSIRIYRHRPGPNGRENAENGPGMMVLHGGGFCVGSFESGARLSRLFVEQTGGVAFNVAYRLAPENPFPAAVYDAYDALRWIADHVNNLGFDPKKGFIIGGESAGADLALAAAFEWTKGANEPPLTGVYSSVTSAATRETVPERYRSEFVSMDECANAPVMTAEAAEFIKSLYKPNPSSPLAYPIAIPNPSLMPKTYFQACGNDPFRDCTLIMEKVWRDAGVPTKLDFYADMPHVFWVFGFVNEETKKHETDSGKGLLWLLEQVA